MSSVCDNLKKKLFYVFFRSVKETNMFVSIDTKNKEQYLSRAWIRIFGVGQGFWVYGIQGLFKSGIRYILQLKYGYLVYHFL